MNVNDLLGFEVGDLKTGKPLHRVEVAGYQKGPVKRHGCPSHGIGLTPDEKELWLTDGANSCMHVFDATVMPPKQVATIPLRDQPGWVTFSLDGRFAFPSTGEVFDARTGEEALQVLRERRFDLVLLDVNMPGMGGLETCRQIRPTSDIAIIMLTVRDAEQIVVLDRGRIVERGPHDELLALGGRYASLVARDADVGLADEVVPTPS